MVGTVKAIVSESSKDSNQSLGMAIIAAAWCLGLVVGPAVAGATADPIGQYNLTISGAYKIIIMKITLSYIVQIKCLNNFNGLSIKLVLSQNVKIVNVLTTKMKIRTFILGTLIRNRTFLLNQSFI